ncbi:MAG: YbjN domain-containing protein [Candidatus Thalassarchaeaceae archaeon]
MREKGMSTESDQDFKMDSPDEIFENFQKLSSTLRSTSYEPSPILSDKIRSYLKDELPEEIESGVEELQEKKPNLIQSPLLESARNYLEKNEWNFEVLSDHSTIALGFEGVNGEWHCMIQTRELEEQMIFYSSLSENISSNRIETMMRFITMANYRLVVGNFELDVTDGELNYKTALDLESVTLNNDMIRNIIHTNLATFDRHLPGVQIILNGGSTEEAMDAIEMNQSSGAHSIS